MDVVAAAWGVVSGLGEVGWRRRTVLDDVLIDGGGQARRAEIDAGGFVAVVVRVLELCLGVRFSD